MKILLINPPRVNGFPVVREERFEHKDMGSVYPPQSLLSCAALLEKNNYQVDLIDANGFDLELSEVKKIIIKKKPDVVFIRIGFDTQKDDLKVLEFAKKRGATTILRNHILSRAPELRDELLKNYSFVDVFLNDEPESVILKLISALEKKINLKEVNGISYKDKKKIITNPPANLIKELDSLPFPAYHLLPNLSVYYSGTFGPPFVTILGSRGCPYTCAFCAYNQQIYRTRTAQGIANEIEWLANNYHIKDFCFLDDVVTLEEERMIKICQAIIAKKLKLRWSVGIRADIVTKKMLVWMKKAGCDEIAVGVESGSETILKNINKKITISDIKKAANICHQLKIKFYAMFILGLPGETKNTINESVKLAKEIRPFYTQFCFATPFPNTKIYNYYKDNNLIENKNWEEFFPLNNYPVIRTKDLSSNDLILLKNKAYKEILFDFRYLLSQVKITDWRWNWRGIKELSKRMVATISSQPVR